MIRVRTGSRLHFGLLSLDPAPARRFGGVGLMIEAPGVEVEARPALKWSADGPLADRALAFARRLAQTLPAEAVHPQHVVVHRAPLGHRGLGTGTQLGLAVARAVSLASGFAGLDGVDLARRVGRGARSAVGIHGFGRGGLLVDGGKCAADEIAPLAARAELPAPWRVVLALPPGAEGLHGAPEARAFAQLASGLEANFRTQHLCRLVLLDILPAAAQARFEEFGEAVYEFNRFAGEAFIPAQGGPYADPRVAELIAFVRSEGFRGVGQSSWGPAVFAFAPEHDRAADLAQRVRSRFALAEHEVFVTRACTHGARTTRPGPGVGEPSGT
jgi:beta-RFAP synthase